MSTEQLRTTLSGIVELAREAHAHWDADRDSKVGKILLALSGSSPRYDRRADALHDALAAPARAHAAGSMLVERSTVYVLNVNGTNRWSATVQPGSDDECRNVAAALASKAAAPMKCTCVYATSKNTPAVRDGYEMGGYLKEACQLHSAPPAAVAAEPVVEKDRLLAALEADMGWFTMRDGAGKMPVAKMRPIFERAVRETSAFSEILSLEAVEVDGRFSHYVNPSTDRMWTGFAIGMRAAERIQAAQTTAPTGPAPVPEAGFVNMAKEAGNG